jgi:hypothetical protein
MSDSVLTPALKALTAKASISGLQECMEALGGIGYLENEESQHINVARLYRDVNVLSIWEGTTNVLGTDFVRTLKARNGQMTLKALRTWLKNALFGSSPRFTVNFVEEKGNIIDAFNSFETEITEKEIEQLIVQARRLMDIFASTIIATLMIVDSERDDDAVSVELFKRYATAHAFGGPYKCDWITETVLDSDIVFGKATEKATSKARL